MHSKNMHLKKSKRPIILNGRNSSGSPSYSQYLWPVQQSVAVIHFVENILVFQDATSEDVYKLLPSTISLSATNALKHLRHQASHVRILSARPWLTLPITNLLHLLGHKCSTRSISSTSSRISCTEAAALTNVT